MKTTTASLLIQLIPDYFNKRIKIPTGQREGKIWTIEQKQNLIDSIYNDFDIPKIYFRVDPKKPEIWYLVDGQQRLESIQDFIKNAFPLAETESLPSKVRGKFCSALEPEDRQEIIGKSLSVIMFQSEDESEEEDMFLRLNNGTPLNAAEKRNAIRGQFRDSIKSLTKNSFFKKVYFSSKRYAYDSICAQLSAIILADGPTNLKGAELKKIYHEKKIYFDKKMVEKTVRRILNLMYEIFENKEPFLKRFNVVTIFTLLFYLDKTYALSSLTKKQLYSFFLLFEKKKSENSKKTEDDTDFVQNLLEFYEKSVNSPDSKDAVEKRHNIILEYFIKEFKDLPLKDPNRFFTDEQKNVVYYFQGGVCSQVDGFICPNKDIKIPMFKGQFDHKRRHAKGGVTTIDNCSFLCEECHTYKTKIEQKLG